MSSLLSHVSAHAITRQDVQIQAQLLKNSFDNLANDIPQNIDLYALTVAGNARQGVFENEARELDAWFDKKIGDDTHSLTLANGLDSWHTYPLANKGNIKRSLNKIGQSMNTEEDMLL